MFSKALLKVKAIFVVLLLMFNSNLNSEILVPMDLSQTDHLKAYGLAYWALEQGSNVKWLLNYRNGSFLMEGYTGIEREARLRGIYYEVISGSEVVQIMNVIENENMEIVLLEKAPKIAVYTPPNIPAWDDAVTLALEYADIKYHKIWDEEVLKGKLSEYDWLHLHHEDFTGQYSKFYINYRQAPWFLDEVARNEEMAKKFGYTKVSQLKSAVSERIKNYIFQGGFLFAMCSAAETFEIALAARGVDIVPPPGDGDPVEPGAQNKLDFSRSLAIDKFRLQTNPLINAFSDIDGHLVNVAGARQPLGYFQLFKFSAKYDPVPTMLTQNHTWYIEDYYGLSTSLMRHTLKKSVTIMAEEEGKPWVKYIHGNYGKGSFTYYGGHDPEDKQHAIGDPPTNLELHKHSPGYRLILNNVLFPAARKKELKT